jgi:hypothetical protein
VSAAKRSVSNDPLIHFSVPWSSAQHALVSPAGRSDMQHPRRIPLRIKKHLVAERERLKDCSERTQPQSVQVGFSDSAPLSTIVP